MPHIWLGLLLCTTAIDALTTCGHIPPKPSQVDSLPTDPSNRFSVIHSQVRHSFIESRRVIRKREANQNLRIKYFYDDSVKKITIEKFQIINVCI